MLTPNMLSRIAKLESDYEFKKSLLEQGDYNAKLERLVDNNKRATVEKILSADKFKSLARAHAGEYIETATRERKSVDLHGMLISDDRQRALKRVFSGEAYVSPILLDDLCHLVEAKMMFEPSDPDLTRMKQEKSKKEKDVFDAKLSLQNAIINALNEIKLMSREAEQFDQLFLQDTAQGDTLGHFCLRGDSLINPAIYLEYSRVLHHLSSEHIYQLLLKCNKEGTSILALHSASRLNFIYLAYKLSFEHLASILSDTRFFEEIITNPDYTQDFLELLNSKFSASALARSKLSELLVRDNQYIILLLSCIKMIDYESSTPHNQLSINIKLLINLLYSFDLPQKDIKELANIPGLKEKAGRYLLTLPINSDNLMLLQYAVDKKCSLGCFFWEWRRKNSSISGRFFHVTDSPATVTALTDRISIMVANYINDVASAPFEASGK